MSLISNPNDINNEIFSYLTFAELSSLYQTNKIINKDIDKFCYKKYKKSFKQLYIDNKCLHCNNLVDNINFKICDNCTLDTCWTCYNKVGNLNLWFMTNWDSSNSIWYPSYKCFGNCIYKCQKCNRKYNNKNDIIIDKCLTKCITCQSK